MTQERCNKVAICCPQEASACELMVNLKEV